VQFDSNRDVRVVEVTVVPENAVRNSDAISADVIRTQTIDCSKRQVRKEKIALKIELCK
jgi:hypothetical protein